MKVTVQELMTGLAAADRDDVIYVRRGARLEVDEEVLVQPYDPEIVVPDGWRELSDIDTVRMLLDGASELAVALAPDQFVYAMNYYAENDAFPDLLQAHEWPRAGAPE